MPNHKLLIPNVSKILSPVIFFLLVLMSTNLSAQDENLTYLSGGLSIGKAPNVEFLSRTSSPTIFSLFGELKYKKIIGRIQLVRAGEVVDENFKGALGFYGSGGYSISIHDKIYIPVLLVFGATNITYTALFSEFTNYSPQLGIEFVPSYNLTSKIAFHTQLRILKGQKYDDRNEAVDMTDFSIGLKITI